MNAPFLSPVSHSRGGSHAPTRHHLTRHAEHRPNGRAAERKPGIQMKWLGLPPPFFPFELTSKADVYGPLFFVWWGREKKVLARFAVGTNRMADAGLWELIHQLGRGELPRPAMSR